MKRTLKEVNVDSGMTIGNEELAIFMRPQKHTIAQPPFFNQLVVYKLFYIKLHYDVFRIFNL